MPREVITPQQREAEAEALRRFFEKAQSLDPSLTQETIAFEMDVTQGLVYQWLSGRTPIPNKRLIWLSHRLSFDPSLVRKSTAKTLTKATTEREERTISLYLRDPDFAKIVDAIAESKGFYHVASQLQSEEPPRDQRPMTVKK